MHALLLTLSVALAGADEIDTLVVCPDAFRSALDPWIDYRRNQGHGLQLLSSGRTSDQLREEIRQAARCGSLRNLVLVGDAPPANKGDSSSCPNTVPTAYRRAKVNIQWGSEPEIATDNWYADLDDDHVPDLAVGRLTVDTRQELTRVVQKILGYEQSLDNGTWRRQINLVAGVGGFGRLADTVLVMTTKRFLTEGVPPAYHTTMTYGSWQSPYCPDPRLFREVTLRRLNEGCLFWIYIGHGQRRYLDQVNVPGGAFPILDVDDLERVRSVRGLPIAMLLACYTGAFDGATDCLAEEMFRSSGGPAAIVCGSRTTMPYGMAVMADAMMNEFFHTRCPTLGQLMLATKRRMVSDDSQNPQRQLLDAVAAALSPDADQLDEERMEHLSLFNLIGDPLMRIRHPGEIHLDADARLIAGQAIRVTGRCELAGQGMVELVCRRDQTRITAPTRNHFQPTHEFLASFDEAYRQANDPVWTSQPFSSSGSDFEVVIDVPLEARGPCHLRAFLTGGNEFAVGARDVFVRRPVESADVVDREATE
jgi:hypothetical protein